MFAAARISDASASVIQSLAEPAIGQSGELDDEPEGEGGLALESPDLPASVFFGSAPDEPESEPEPSPDVFVSPAEAAELPSSFVLDARAVDRSFFAHPLPLK